MGIRELAGDEEGKSRPCNGLLKRGGSGDWASAGSACDHAGWHVAGRNIYK
jgi:hypothetical protein